RRCLAFDEKRKLRLDSPRSAALQNHSSRGNLLWRGPWLHRRVQWIAFLLEGHQDIAFTPRIDNQRLPAVRSLGRDPNRFIGDRASGYESEPVGHPSKHQHGAPTGPTPLPRAQEHDRVKEPVSIEVD